MWELGACCNLASSHTKMKVGRCPGTCHSTILLDMCLLCPPFLPHQAELQDSQPDAGLCAVWAPAVLGRGVHGPLEPRTVLFMACHGKCRTWQEEAKEHVSATAQTITSMHQQDSCEVLESLLNDRRWAQCPSRIPPPSGPTQRMKTNPARNLEPAATSRAATPLVSSPRPASSFLF